MLPDYSDQNLRGRSFKNQNLEGADFSYADIRSTNFTGANLRGANFTGAKAGLQKRWRLLLVLLSLSFSAISYSLFFLDGGVITLIFNNPGGIENPVGGWGALITTILVYIIIIRKGIGINIAAFATFALALIFGVALYFALSEGVGSIVGAGTLSSATTGTFAVAGTIALALAFSIDRTTTITTTIIFVIAVIIRLAITKNFIGALTIATALLSILSAAIISAYIAGQAMKGNERYSLVRNVAVAFAAIGGTSFRGADLTDANFTAALLKSTDLRNAKLIRTCFHKTKLLDRVRPGNSYLKHPEIRHLILTGQGQDKNFDRFNLRGINLKGALLTDTSFNHSDLSRACLQDADLSRAKLVKTQLDYTDFTGATLTGAYIQDWNITHETNFRGVKCEYLYMRLPTKENPNPLRKPDNNAEVFADGDFGEFIQPIFDTLDLYHNQGVDPRAIAISFKELAENNPDAELEIVAMEKRGEDKFLLRAKAAPEANKSELSGQYFETYNEIKGLPEREIQLLLAEKDGRIRSLENFVSIALKTPSFYSNTQAENLHSMNNNPGGTSQNMSGGTMYGGMQAAGDNSTQQMETNVTQADEKQLTQTDVIQMLARIEQLLKSTPELPEAEKEKSLRYLGAAKEETEAAEPDKEFAAGNLKRMAQTIETASKTVESGKTLWGNIKPVLKELPAYFGVAATFFGL